MSCQSKPKKVCFALTARALTLSRMRPCLTSPSDDRGYEFHLPNVSLKVLSLALVFATECMGKNPARDAPLLWTTGRAWRTVGPLIVIIGPTPRLLPPSPDAQEPLTEPHLVGSPPAANTPPPPAEDPRSGTDVSNCRA